MPPRPAGVVAAVALAVFTAEAAAQAGQSRTWNDPHALDLVSRAIARRNAQLADTGLADYRAVARGYLTFLAQLGEGFPDPPQVVRADQLAVEVYWRTPNLSKQRVIGRRAALVRPTDIAYHSDHLGVVQNNFPAIIRLGEGDEVRDVPHPLSLAGRDAYDYAEADSLAIRIDDRTWDVIAVEFRPRDDRLPRAVGTVYLDRATASVVRLAVTFTRAALIDPALEDVSIVLDNGLVDGRFWLPRRQEIEIRRTGTWLDFPARGIIRGEWDLCCVEANRGVPPALFGGPEITLAPPAVLAAYPFAGRLEDSIAARVESAGPARGAALLQARASSLVGAAALRRADRARIAARSLSQFARVNRVEGLALGGGLSVPVAGVHARGGARYGLDDRTVKFDAEVSRRFPAGRTVTVGAFDEYRGVGDEPEMSTLGNSIAAQEFGFDATDEFRVAGFRVGIGAGPSAGAAGTGRTRLGWRLEVERTRESALAVHAAPSSGRYRPAFGAEALSRTSIRVDVAGGTGPLGGPAVQWRLSAAASRIDRDDRATSGADTRAAASGRLAGSVRLSHAAGVGEGHVELRAATALGAEPPAQDLAFFGGPVSAPGYDVHSMRGMTGGTVRVEWRVAAGGFRLPLGRFGAAPVGLVVAPFVAGGAARGGPAAGAPAFQRAAGLGLITMYEAVRLDVARGVDRGGRWIFAADFGKPFWRIL